MPAKKNITDKNIIQIFKETLTKNFMNMQGRATRREFNLFFLTLYLIFMSLYFYKTTLELNFEPSETINFLISIPFTILICWATIPSIFLIIRRSHDLNISALGLLFSIVTPALVIFILILILKSGTQGFNKYGPNPYEIIEAKTAQNILIEPENLDETEKTPLEKFIIEEKQKNLLDPNKPSYKV